MGLKEILGQTPYLTIETLKRFQAEYDRIFVDDDFIGFDKVRHTYAHMGNLFGRLGKYVQMTEDGCSDVSSEDIRTKVIPDLLVYAFWLAGEFGVEVDKVYLNRMVENIRRLHLDKISPEELDGLETEVSERFAS